MLFVLFFFFPSLNFSILSFSEPWLNYCWLSFDYVFFVLSCFFGVRCILCLFNFPRVGPHRYLTLVLRTGYQVSLCTTRVSYTTLLAFLFIFCLRMASAGHFQGFSHCSTELWCGFSICRSLRCDAVRIFVFDFHTVRCDSEKNVTNRTALVPAPWQMTWF